MTILKEIRESCKLTTSELSRRSGVHRRDIYNLEKGKHSKKENFHKVVDTLAEMVELSYIAGLVDRASSISITKVKAGSTKTMHHDHYMARFVVHSVHEEIPTIIKKILGVGAVAIMRSNNKKPKDTYQYYAHCYAAGEAIEKLLPYLKIKRQKAQVLLDFRKEVVDNVAKRMRFTLEASLLNDATKWDQDKINEKYEEYYQRIRQV